MKHLQAGLMVGGIVMLVLIAVSALWAALQLFIGGSAAIAVMVLVLVFVVVATIIDWMTEKK